MARNTKALLIYSQRPNPHLCTAPMMDCKDLRVADGGYVRYDMNVCT